MRVDLNLLLFTLLVVISVVLGSPQENDEEAINGVAETAEGVADMDDKRRIMRYGRGTLMRWGKRGTLMRYGRGGIFRYGKRSDDEGLNDVTQAELDQAKRLFRWGKRSDDASEEPDFKRLFRWGKRSGEADVGDDEMFNEEEKRRLMRYGKRGLDLEDLVQEAKRRLMRYGRDIRTSQGPHVPFRFGKEE